MEQTTSENLAARVSNVAGVVRQSEAYPAIAGAVAGGIAGAVLALIIANVISARRPSARAAEHSVEKKSARSFTVRDLVELATVVAGLAKQVQAWREASKTPANR